MKQLDILQEKKEICAFTGHRELSEDFSEKELKNAIKYALKSGFTEFYNGLAMGFDLRAAEVLLSFKKKYPSLKLIACIPCPEQDKYFSDQDKKRYRRILEKADETVLISDRYFQGCMQKRDRYMVENADLLIAYCKKSTGGTAYTVKYFEKHRPNGELILL